MTRIYQFQIARHTTAPVVGFMSNGAWEQAIAVYILEANSSKWVLHDTRAKAGHGTRARNLYLPAHRELLVRIWPLHKTQPSGAHLPWLNSNILPVRSIFALPRHLPNSGTPDARDKWVELAADDNGGGAPTDRNLIAHLGTERLVDVRIVSTTWKDGFIDSPSTQPAEESLRALVEHHAEATPLSLCAG